MFAATAQVYFRDLTNFLPYLMRIWLYTSPILFYAEDVPESLKPILLINPMYPLLGTLNDVVIEGKSPPPILLAVSFCLGGCLHRGRDAFLHLQGERVCDPSLRPSRRDERRARLTRIDWAVKVEDLPSPTARPSRRSRR